jgi:hypothetical protein
VLTLYASPVVNLGQDTAVCANLTVTLNATTTGAVSYLWYPTLETTPTIAADSAGAGIGPRQYHVLVTDNHNCTGIDTVTVTFKDCTGIGEPEGLSVRIFPNPSTGVFTLEATTARREVLTLHLLNTKGSAVYTKENIVVNGSVSESIDAAHLASGTYYLEVSNGTGKLIRKVVIRK